MKSASVAILLLMFAACSASPSPIETSSPLSAEVRFEAYPGSQWYGPDGDPVPEESNIINAIKGPEHCDWDSGVMLHLGWPLGRDAANFSETRQYFRDPQRVFPADDFMTKYAADVDLPKTAENTGYRTDFMELWLDRTDGSAAYLVFSDHVERWPRSRGGIACA